tara:strand:- start:38 stop:217 length:180 start_codon:yes stop_codon:yes gene_type:complete
MIIDTLNSKPEVGIASSFGTVFVSWLEILNPVLSFISLLIGISVGLTTLYLQLRKVKEL